MKQEPIGFKKNILDFLNGTEMEVYILITLWASLYASSYLSRASKAQARRYRAFASWGFNSNANLYTNDKPSEQKYP